MKLRDIIRLTLGSVIANRSRSMLTIVGIAIGIGAVVLLTSIGEGVNRYVMSTFTQFGTNHIEITPGKVSTMGNSLGAINTVRPLSINDALALSKLPYIDEAVTFSMGNAEIEANRLQRRTTVYGTSPGFPNAFSYQVVLGDFLPDDDPHAPRPTAVLGSKVSNELFGNSNPVGSFVRVGGNRFRVVGVMGTKGQMLGIDLDDAVYLPARRAMELFNRESLMQIHLVHSSDAPVKEVQASVEKLLIDRHGIDDVTVKTQKQMMDVLGSVLTYLTAIVAGLGGISLIVGGIGILTIMTIVVRERTGEIGLFRALGATQLQIMALFLGEAITLAGLGGLIGLVLGFGGAQFLSVAFSNFPVHTSLVYVLLAECTAVTIGVVAGVLPAHKAANLLPVDALRAE